jgi:hypothetical protein
VQGYLFARPEEAESSLAVWTTAGGHEPRGALPRALVGALADRAVPS